MAKQLDPKDLVTVEELAISGYVIESAPLAIFAVQRVADLGLDAMLESAIQCGGDTDTIASMTGQIAGAWLGFSSIPPVLVSPLPKSPDVLTTARSFAARVAQGACEPRGS